MRDTWQRDDGPLAAANKGASVGPSKDEVNVSAAREALSKEAETIFKEVVGDGAGMTKEFFRKAAEKAAIGMKEDEVDRLFQELDVDGNGGITLQEYKNGLNATPSVGELEIMKSLLLASSVKLVETLAALMLQKMHAHMRKSPHAKKDADGRHARCGSSGPWRGVRGGKGHYGCVVRRRAEEVASERDCDNSASLQQQVRFRRQQPFRAFTKTCPRSWRYWEPWASLVQT
eukprot:1302057-Rhodomonas_salina.2